MSVQGVRGRLPREKGFYRPVLGGLKETMEDFVKYRLFRTVRVLAGRIGVSLGLVAVPI